MRGTPWVAMDEWFIRVTDDATITDEDVQRLWGRDVAFVHYPDYPSKDDRRSVLRSDYADRRHGSASALLGELAKEGGDVWFQTRLGARAKIGRVEPQRVRFEECTYTTTQNARWRRPGDVAIVKGVKITKVREVEGFELPVLRQTRPTFGAICRWRKAGGHLSTLVSGQVLATLWSNLSAHQHEAVTSEFLCEPQDGLPRIVHQFPARRWRHG